MLISEICQNIWNIFLLKHHAYDDVYQVGMKTVESFRANAKRKTGSARPNRRTAEMVE
jgi:hypothetical protein